MEGTTAGQSVKSCVHRWIIDTPNGAENVQGTCRRCGVNRQFVAAGKDPTARDFQMPFTYSKKLAMEEEQME